METFTISVPNDKIEIIKQILSKFGVSIIETDQNLIKLSAKQQEEIITSRFQINLGLCVTQTELDDEVGKWLDN